MDSVRYIITACFITLVSYFQHFYIAELYPYLSHCWGIPNIETLLSYTLSYYIVELAPILIHCCRLSRNVVGSQSESSKTPPNSTMKNWPDQNTNRESNNYLYLCGRKVKPKATKGNPVDQSSCNSFSELIHGYEVCKTIPLVVGSEKRSA